MPQAEVHAESQIQQASTEDVNMPQASLQSDDEMHAPAIMQAETGNFHGNRNQ